MRQLRSGLAWHLAFSFGLLCTGCQAGPPPAVFTERDLQDLAALCDDSPCPISFSALQYAATGHLKVVLAERRFIDAQEFLDIHLSGEVARLRNRAALVVLEHRNSHIAGGILILLFHPEATRDVITVEQMIPPDIAAADALQVRDTYPYLWYQPDKEPDHIQDALINIPLEVKAELVDANGEPQYLWRWGGV